MKLVLNPSSIDDYRTFLQIKTLPVFKIRGREAWFPDEYASRIGVRVRKQRSVTYEPMPFLFDYQRDISRIAIEKRKFALFMDCGLGKSLCYFEFARTSLANMRGKGALILTPPMVIDQTCDEASRFYGSSFPIEPVKSGSVNGWLKTCAGKIGVTNYEAFRNELERGQLGALIADEAHALSSHYGKYAQGVVSLGRGLDWKLSGTGTPAPNDRIEYANQAVFLDHFPTVNSFLAKYFVNRGQTSERWVLKRYGLEAFYKSLSHWSIFLSNPAVYGWKDNCESIPPINVHIHEVETTEEQTKDVQRKTGQLYAHRVGGITKRGTLSRIAKGLDGTATNKYDYIAKLIGSWPDESTIIWCWFNPEQDRLASMFPEAASIQGSTKHADRVRLLDDFITGRRKVLISKPDVLGYGLNLQIATRQVFSSLIDSYRDFYQAVKRSNRYGSTKPLNVHIPVIEIERPMVENVLRKAARIEEDTRQQEVIFRAARQGESVDTAISENGIDVSELLDDGEEA